MNNILKISLCVSLLLSTTTIFAKEYNLLAFGEKGSPQNNLLLEKIKKFESMHKDAKIKLDMASGQAYHTKLKVLSVARKLPDVMTIFPGKRSDYVTKKNLIADLNPFIDKKMKSVLLPQALAPQGGNGEIYEIPQNLTLTGVVYANKSLMDKLKLTYPKTYKDWLGQVKVIQEAGLTPLAIGNKSPWVMQSIVLSAILGRTAGDAWLDKAIHGKASFTDKPFVLALKTLKQMYDSGLLDKATPSWDYNQGTNAFLSAKAVYSMNGGWIVNNYIKSAKPEFLKNIELHRFPAIVDEVNKSSVSGTLGTGFGIKASLSVADKKILFDLVKLQAGLGMEKASIGIGNIPLVKKLDFPENTNPLIKNLKTLMDDSKVTYVFDAVMDPQSVDLLQNLIQELFLGTKTPEDVAKEFESYAAANSPMRK
ncbi:MAG: ABC transporter substrate-binding protein [Ostreibacterium sp.]